MSALITGQVTTLDGLPETGAVLTASIIGEQVSTTVFSTTPVTTNATPQGVISLPLAITTPTTIHITLTTPGRVIREATFTAQPGVAYALADVLAGRVKPAKPDTPDPTPPPTPTPAPVPGGVVSPKGVVVDPGGDTVSWPGTLDAGGDTLTIA